MAMISDEIGSKLTALGGDRSELIRLLLKKGVRTGEPVGPAASARRAGESRFPASWPQQRLWFIDQLEQGAAGYQISLFARLRGQLNQVALQHALDGLVQRHEVLRTVFISEEGQLCQRVLPEGSFPIRT